MWLLYVNRIELYIMDCINKTQTNKFYSNDTINA